MRLRERLTNLELREGEFQGAVWIIAEPGETSEAARARYESEHGPIGERMAIIWVSTGVPRGPEAVACA